MGIAPEGGAKENIKMYDGLKKQIECETKNSSAKASCTIVQSAENFVATIC